MTTGGLATRSSRAVGGRSLCERGLGPERQRRCRDVGLRTARDGVGTVSVAGPRRSRAVRIRRPAPPRAVPRTRPSRGPAPDARTRVAEDVEHAAGQPQPLATARSHRVRLRQAPGTPPGDAPRSSGQPAPLRRALTDPHYPSATSHQHRHREAGRRLVAKTRREAHTPSCKRRPRPSAPASPGRPTRAGRTDDGVARPAQVAGHATTRRSPRHRPLPTALPPGRRVPSAHRTAKGADDAFPHLYVVALLVRADGRSDEALWQRRRNPRRCTPTLSAPRRSQNHPRSRRVLRGPRHGRRRLHNRLRTSHVARRTSLALSGPAIDRAV
jgi:hypothetical protein